MNNDQMKPIDAGAPVLIPQGNMNDIPGTFGWMQKEYNRRKGKKSKSNSFKYGYGGQTSGFFTSIDGTMTMP